MESSRRFFFIALLSAIAGGWGPGWLGDLAAPVFGHEVHAASVVLWLGVAGCLFGLVAGIACLVIEWKERHCRKPSAGSI